MEKQLKNGRREGPMMKQIKMWMILRKVDFRNLKNDNSFNTGHSN